MASLEEIRNFFKKEFPHYTVKFEFVGERSARIRQKITNEHLRPGGTVSGPVMMSMADCVAYVAILGEVGLIPLAVTTNLNISFLKKPVPERDLIAEADLLKTGKRLKVAEVRIYSEGTEQLVAHASVTYSLPPKGKK